MADQYAREVDFFSIGTNDLTQYILAVDRGNDLVSDRYEELDPAVLAMIARTTAAADEAGIPVSICGEMASDPLATAILIGLGLSSLSASPTFLPEIKRVIRSMQRIEAKTLAERVMRIYDPAERRKTLMDWLKEHAPGYYAFLKESENSSQEIDS
jgi:phosphotransferase system enzyme I (PtsI)